MAHVLAGVEPIHDSRLMARTGQNSNRTIFDGHHWMVETVRCEMTTRTVDSASRVVLEKRHCPIRGVATGVGKLFDVLVTANDRNRELVE